VAKMNLPGEAETPLVEDRAAGAEAGARFASLAENETVAMGGTAEETETVAMAVPAAGASSGSLGSGDGRTMPGSLVGTPAYMSPEQALGGDIDFRSDIYSLAVVAYSLVCGELPFSGRTSGLIEFHRTGSPRPPASVAKAPRDVSDVVLAGLAREPAGRPQSAIEFTRRFHNAVDAEFFALRRSRSFLLQHLAAFLCLVVPIFAALLSAVALLEYGGRKLLPAAILGNALVPLAAAILLVFGDNLLRATAALIAMDEQVRVRRFLSFRVFWKLVKAVPRLAATQARSIFLFGPGWPAGDCLWPVLCVVENLRGKEALLRSRRLMQGLNSAGRALAIRHFALAALAIGDLVESLGGGAGSGHAARSSSSAWFPVFAIFAAAPLFLYDRTAAREEGPLLELNRTPEVRVTGGALSVSSILWLTIGVIYLIYAPIKLWFFSSK
ncbi:MAG: hypothetical protein KGN36_10765, partial [Acidobacteriota bacterium]|nr:hypothetical protein [Acidobacteriota bacterium]